MAYQRGSQSTDIELSRVQSWIEKADSDLYGEGGKTGVIEMVQQREARERERKDAADRSDKRLTLTLGLLASIPVLLKIAEHFHWF